MADTGELPAWGVGQERRGLTPTRWHRFHSPQGMDDAVEFLKGLGVESAETAG